MRMYTPYIFRPLAPSQSLFHLFLSPLGNLSFLLTNISFPFLPSFLPVCPFSSNTVIELVYNFKQISNVTSGFCFVFRIIVSSNSSNRHNYFTIRTITILCPSYYERNENDYLNYEKELP